VIDANLTESVWDRAKGDAARVYPTTGFGVAATLMTIIFGSVAAVASSDGNASSEIAIPILGGAAALALTFLVVLAFQLVVAPVRQRNALRAAAPLITDQPANLRAQLWNTYRKGVDLCRRIDNEPNRPSYDRRLAEEWVEEAACLLVGNVPDEVSQQFFSAAEYEGMRQRLEGHVDALKEIIDGMAGPASTATA
jgi:hypothetical protein